MRLVGLLALEAAAEGHWTGGLGTAAKRLNDGTSMPIIGLGTWKSPPGEVEAAVRHALCEAGYRHIDAAQIYMNQEEVGRGINHAIKDCGLKRKDLWVTSKVWNVDFQHVEQATDRILKELDLEYVDQLLLHWPTPYKKPPPECPPTCGDEFAGTDDPMRPRGSDGKLVLADLNEYPLAKTWSAMEKVREQGKTRSIGVSNFSPGEIDRLLDGNRVVPAVNQVEAHIFWNQIELRAEMMKRGISIVAYSPLGNPAVYGAKDGMGSDLISKAAADAGLTPAQVMLNYLISLGDIVIPKSVTPQRIRSNIDFNLTLKDEQIMELSIKAKQQRLTNPPNRKGGAPVFPIEPPKQMAPTILRVRSEEL